MIIIALFSSNDASLLNEPGVFRPTGDPVGIKPSEGPGPDRQGYRVVM